MMSANQNKGSKSTSHIVNTYTQQVQTNNTRTPQLSLLQACSTLLVYIIISYSW